MDTRPTGSNARRAVAPATIIIDTDIGDDIDDALCIAGPLCGIIEMARQLHGFCDLAGIPLLSVDSDGQVGELIPLATATEVNVELRRLVPLARSGGHIINPDHAIPAEVPYGDFLYLIERLGREMGACL